MVGGVPFSKLNLAGEKKRIGEGVRKERHEDKCREAEERKGRRKRTKHNLQA